MTTATAYSTSNLYKCPTVLRNTAPWAAAASAPPDPRHREAGDRHPKQIVGVIVPNHGEEDEKQAEHAVDNTHAGSPIRCSAVAAVLGPKAIALLARANRNGDVGGETDA